MCGCFARQLLKGVYGANPMDTLNFEVQYAHEDFLGHCLPMANTALSSTLFLLVVILFTASILHKAVSSQRRLRLAEPICLGLFTLVFIYAVNANHRVYAYHGFFRAGIVYQILNGYIPPLDPLFAGETVHSPWGNELLVACVSRLFHITPPYSFAILNVVCLVLVMILVYKISSLLIKDERANTLSVMIAIFGIAVFPNALTRTLRTLIPHLEFRAAHLARKFLCPNGVPLGLAFFFLFLSGLLSN